MRYPTLAAETQVSFSTERSDPLRGLVRTASMFAA